MGTCRPIIHLYFSSCQILCIRHFLTSMRYILTNRNHNHSMQPESFLLGYLQHSKGDFNGIPYYFPELTRDGIIPTPDTIVLELNTSLVLPMAPGGETFRPSQTPGLVGIIVNIFNLLIFIHSPFEITLTKNLEFLPVEFYPQFPIHCHQCLS